MMYPTLLDATKPTALLSACPAYKATPLQHHSFNGRSLLIKDETERMGLGAFKALGGVYAVARLIEAKIGSSIDPKNFQGDYLRQHTKKMTFVCASAGNHGLSVAAGAHLFGAKSRIYLSQHVPEEFASRLREKGAEVVRSGDDYEASIRAAIVDTEKTGAIHLADGSWKGYTEPPRLVMEGYTIIAEEMRETLTETGDWPSHVYLQAGVGGFAASIAYMIRLNWTIQPKIIVVEPEAAPCLRDSIKAGQVVTVEGPVSNMGRLDCKTPSLLAFNILSECADEWITISDDTALEAVEHAREIGLSTTPSGAAGLAACLIDDARSPLVIISEGGL